MRKTTKWPCIFYGSFVREQVDPRLYEQDPKTPFGPFRRLWRTEHCATINPYGSESCPYTEEECALAFYQTASETLRLAERSKTGLFRSFARYAGYRRADEKPLARDRYDRRTDGHPQGTNGLRGGPAPGSVHDAALGGRGQLRDVPVQRPVGVHGTGHRPQRLGDILQGRDGTGSRTQPYRRHEGETSADIDGHARDPVSPPPSRRLGDQPSSGDPDLHQGGE